MNPEPIQIVIATYMRETNQKTFQGIPPELYDRTWLVTHNDRGSTLREANPSARVIELSEEPGGIADVRQMICERFRSMGFPKILLLDDTCEFYRSFLDLSGPEPKRRLAKGRLGTDTLDDWLSMLSHLEGLLTIYPQVGISPRPGNNRNPEPIQECVRVYSAAALNLEWIEELRSADDRVRYDGMRIQKGPQILEDFYFSLSLLQAGVPNAMTYAWAMYHTHGQPGGVQAPGTGQRTSETQLAALRALQELFPEFITIRQKKANGWQQEGGDGLRWESIIQWQRCYRAGKGAESKPAKASRVPPAAATPVTGFRVQIVGATGWETRAIFMVEDDANAHAAVWDAVTDTRVTPCAFTHSQLSP